MNQYAKDRLDPRWQQFRLRVFERDKFACIDCGSSTATLHAHHSYYCSGRKPWEYPMWSVSTLCDKCHSFRHDPEERALRFEENPNYKGFEEWEEAINFLSESPSVAGDVWWFAAEISQLAARNGISVTEQLKQTSKAIMWEGVAS